MRLLKTSFGNKNYLNRKINFFILLFIPSTKGEEIPFPLHSKLARQERERGEKFRETKKRS